MPHDEPKKKITPIIWMVMPHTLPTTIPIMAFEKLCPIVESAINSPGPNDHGQCLSDPQQKESNSYISRQQTSWRLGERKEQIHELTDEKHKPASEG